MTMRSRPGIPAVTALCSATAIAISCAAAVLAMGAPGCTTTTSDALPPESAAEAGSLDGGGDASGADCTSCVAEECAGAWAVCLTDSRCVALRACNNPFAESQGARDQCFCDGAAAAAATPDGGADPLAAYAAFASCNDARTCGKCATDCSSTCAGGATKTTAGACGAGGDAGADAGTDAGVPPVTASVDACSSCVANSCNDARKACALGTECKAFLGCVYGCADASCADACGKAHSTGKASATELSTCTLTSCRSACGL